MTNVIPLPATLAETEERLAKLRGHNESSMKNLQTHGVQLDNMIPILVRIDAIIDFLIGAEGFDRLRFEIDFEQHMQKMMEQFLSQVFAAKLTAGIQGVEPSSLVLKR
jgi:hypothetical protein